MTDKQKDELNKHVCLHSPIHHGDKMRYLNNGETIQFTNSTFYSQNALFEINHDYSREIWLSQLNCIFLSDDLRLCNSLIQFKGKEPVPIRIFGVFDFWDKIKDKKFKVQIEPSIHMTFNVRSSLWNTKALFTYQDALNYISKCISNNQISEIGDLLKSTSLYHLIEI